MDTHGPPVVQRREQQLCAPAGDFSGVKLMWLLFGLFYGVIMNSCISQVEPFFPTYATDHFGATEMEIGLVIALMPLTYAVVSQLVARGLGYISHLSMLSCGLVMLSGSTAAFPFAGSLGLAALIRCLQGVGSAAIMNPIVALNALLFPRHMSTVTGLMEAATGLGFMIGPTVGGLLYQVGGYKLTFLASGGFSGILTIAFFFFRLSAGHRIQEQKQQAIDQQAESRAAWDDQAEPVLMDQLPLVVHCGSTVLMSVSYGFLGPILATELQKVLNAGAFVTGAIFAIGAAVYFCMAPLVGLLADNVTGNRPLIFAGFVIVGLSLALIGPAPIFPWEGETPQWIYKTGGMALLGLGVGLSIPLVPDMVQGEKGAHGAENRIAGLWGTMFSIGEVLGPLAGGSITQAFGFRNACTVVSIVMVLWALFLWLLAMGGHMGWRCPSGALAAVLKALGVWDRAGKAPGCEGPAPLIADAEEPLLGTITANGALDDSAALASAAYQTAQEDGAEAGKIGECQNQR